ncbi:MAG: hypothetical protein KGR46_05485 [Verrucomicrobia bacterium]|nr:hypothetical protein [Verrucomicrobiota bacterium]
MRTKDPDIPNTTEEQLELFDIVPDRPLPSPNSAGAFRGEPHVEWLRRQSEDQLRILLEILQHTPGFRRA